MSKREQRLKQLKKADRRRSRRPVAAATPHANLSMKSEVLAQISQTLSEFAEKHASLCDQHIVQAIRDSLRGRTCEDSTAAQLQSRFDSLKHEGSSNDRVWCDAMQTFLGEVEEITRGAQDARSFINYLQVMAS